MASWLNQSFSSLKGQLTTLASEALGEAPPPPDTDTDTDTEQQQQLAQLQSLCDAQMKEIKSLRRENTEFLLQKNKFTPQHRPDDKSHNEEESSWFWDPQEDDSNPRSIDENESLRERIRTLEAQVSDMRSSSGSSLVNDLERQLELTRSENANLTRSLEDLDSQNQLAMEELLKIKNELQRNYDSLLKDHTKLVSDVETLNSKRDDNELEDANEKLHRTVETLRHKYDNLEKVHRLLTENTEKFQEENMYMSEENSKLLADLEELQERFDNLEHASKTYTNSIEKVKEENHELNEENFKLQEEITRLQNDLEEMSKSKHASPEKQVGQVSDEKYRELEEKFLQLEQQFSENVPSSKPIRASTIRDANAQDVIDKLKFEIVELQNKLNTNEEIKRLNLENDHLRKEIESLIDDKRSLPLDALKTVFDKYVPFDIIGIEKSLKHSQSSEDFLKYVEVALKTLSEFQSRNETLEIRVSENSKIINNLESKMNDLNAEMYFAKSDLALRERELSEMKNNNDFLIAEIGALKSPSKLEPILEQNEDNVLMLQSELEDCSNLNRSIEAKLENYQKEIKVLATERDSLKKQLKEAEDESLRTKNKFEEDENEKHSELQKKLNESKSEIDRLKSQLCLSAAENEKLKIDLSIIDNEKIILLDEVSDLKAEVLSKAIICEHTKKIEKEKIELELKLSDYDMLKNNLDSVTIENSSLKSKVEELLKYISSLSEIEKVLTSKELELQQSKSNLTELEAQLNIGQKRELEMAQLIQDLNYKLESTSDSESKFKEQVENLCVELTGSKKLYENLEVKYAELQKRIEENSIEKDHMLEKSRVAQLESSHIEDRHRLEQKILESTEAQKILQAAFEELKSKKDEEINVLLANFESKNSEYETILTKYNNLHDECAKNQNLRDDHEKSSQELTNIQHQHNLAIKSFAEKEEKMHAELKKCFDIIKNDNDKLSDLEQLNSNMNHQIEKLTAEKNELVLSVTQKHNESVNYHAEIQRLSNVLHDQTVKYEEMYKAHQELQNSSQENCKNCSSLMEQLKASEHQYSEIARQLEEIKSTVITREEIEKLQEKNIFLVEKCDILGKNLLQEQSNTKQILLEKNQIFEKEQSLEKEIERLRRHLLEVEEAHTHELVGAEQRCQELQTSLAVVEEKAKHSSTLYTSNNIRANQEVETLRNQLRLVEKQRDDIQSQLNQSEDRNNKNLAALTNLQCVLEQFQLDKNRDNEAAAGRLRRELEQSHEENRKLQAEMANLHEKLRDSNNGLKAAARLSSQLEARAAQLNDMKLAVEKLEVESSQWKEKYHNTISNQQDKVDKSLIKNLLIGLIQASNQKKENHLQVLRLLSTVLDFDQSECERVGLGSKVSDRTGDSLAQEFIRFLEKESRPALNTVLPNLLNLGQTNEAFDGKPPARKISRILSSPLVSNHQQSAGNDSPNSQTSVGSRSSPHHLRASPAPNLLLDNRPVAIVPISIDNAIMANINSSPVTVVDTNISRSDTAPSGFSLFTPIASPDIGVNQTRNTEGAILKNVLKDT